jgi:hypothetical protein
MKRSYKQIHVWAFIAVAVACLTACVNGDSTLTGKWQLREYDFADGHVIHEDSVFYNLQKGVFSANCISPQGAIMTFWGKYALKDGEICITLLPGSSQSPAFARYFGWDADERTFLVDRMTASDMVLEYDETRYRFRKFG